MNNNLIQEYKKYQMGNFYRIIILIASIILGTCINIFFESTNYISKALQLHDIGTFITASLASPLSGIMCCLISSIINPMFNKAVSTYIFTFAAEIAVLIMSFFISKGWMKSLPKACLAGFLNVCITFAGVVINYIISGLSLMSALKFITRENLIKNFLYGMPIQFIVILIAYLAFNYLPDRVLVKLPHGIYYVRDEEFQAFIKAYHLKCRKQSIELKVYYGTAILVILLTFSASFSFNTLYFNDVAKLQGNNILQSIKEKKLIPDKKIDEESIDIDVIKQTINDGLPLIEWSEPEAPYKNLGFFLKFISMLLCIELAVVVICVNYLRHSIILPIISVSARASKCSPNEHNFTEAIDICPLSELDIKSGDEIEELYNSILKMVYGFNHYVRRIYHEQQLMSELEVEKKAGKAKSDFLSNMSHELRTPINAVIGLDEIILRETDDEKILALAYDIQTAGKSLLGLINDILDFSKIEAGKMDIIPVNYDLSSVINDLVNMIKIRADKKNLDFIINVDNETPHLLYGDEIRLKQVITNILTNAVKYTEKGSVSLNISYSKITPREINLHISIEDTGIGMKDEDLGKLFKAFERIEEKRNRTVEGTGLGLSITQSLLNLMGSRLEVKSSYGKGSVFYFELKQTVLSDEPIGDINEAHKKAISQSEQYHESFIAPDAEILVVDDTEMNLTVVKGLLKQTQIKIDTALSGFECLDMVKKKHYDIIFLDHRMPEMDGMETLEKFNELDDNKSAGIPVIALTANALSGAREEYIDAGFTDYLTKPIDYKKLEKMIMDYLPSDKVKPADNPHESNESSVLAEWILNSPDINVNEALRNCGSKETFLEALHNFYDIIDDNSAKIEDFYNESDWHNYNIKVHALKSSARLIGAEKLSNMAFSLEVASEEDGTNEGYIKIHTPKLLNLYRSYKDKLSALEEDVSDDDTNKNPISKDDLTDAYAAIIELIESVDYETAEELIKSLDNYALPQNEKKKFSELKKYASAFDWNSAAKVLKP